MTDKVHVPQGFRPMTKSDEKLLGLTPKQVADLGTGSKDIRSEVGLKRYRWAALYVGKGKVFIHLEQELIEDK